MKLEEAAKLLASPTKMFRGLLAKTRRVFSFTQERANRVVRFVLVVNAYRKGRLVQDIVNEQGCSRSTVLRYARLAGLAKRPKGFDPELKGKVLAMCKEGRPYTEIANVLGVSQAYISLTAKAAGLQRYKK